MNWWKRSKAWLLTLAEQIRTLETVVILCFCKKVCSFNAPKQLRTQSSFNTRHKPSIEWLCLAFQQVDLFSDQGRLVTFLGVSYRFVEVKFACCDCKSQIPDNLSKGNRNADNFCQKAMIYTSLHTAVVHLDQWILSSQNLLYFVS